VALHDFYPEELLLDIFIVLIVELRDFEWDFFWILRIVALHHHTVAVSDNDSCHLTHFRTNAGLILREYIMQEASLTCGLVKDPNCINLPCGILVHQLVLESRHQSLVLTTFGVVEALGVENL
jgi:hypothetical protein